MRKEGWLFCLLLLVLCSACTSAPVVSRRSPPPYHLTFTKQGYAIFDANYRGTFTQDDGTKLSMSLSDVREKESDGTFDAFLTLQGQVNHYPARGSIAVYQNGHFPPGYGDGPFFLGATYLGMLWMFSGTLDVHTGVLSGSATLSAPGIAGNWVLTPL